MAVVDNGLEALRKATDPQTPGSQEYVINVKSASNAPIHIVPTAPNGQASTVRKTITGTPSLACVGGANMTSRSLLYMEPDDEGVVWSFDPSMAAYHRLFKTGIAIQDLGPDINVYIKSTGVDVDVTISEVAHG